MWGKISKGIGKRLAVVALSFVLAIGMFGKSGAVETKAAGSMSITVSFTIEELPGAEALDIQGVVIDAYRTGGSEGSNSTNFEIGMNDIVQSVVGNQVTYTCTIENGPYHLLDFFIVQNGKIIWVATIGDHENPEYVIANGSQGEGSLRRFRFMDGATIWYEQYALCSMLRVPYLQFRGQPQKDGHTFVGWTKDEGGSTIWDFTDFTNSLYVPTTFYAVWEHPTEDTWTGNHDSNSHWKECSCGAKANVAVHIEDNGTVTEEPTATKNGVKTYLCRECGYTMRTEVLPATGAPTVSENDPPKPDNPNTPGDSDTPVNPDAPGNSDTPVNPDAPGNSDTPANPTVPGSTNNTPSNPNVSGGNNTSVTTSVSTTASGRKNGEPKTGDVPYVEIYATAAMIAGMAYLLLYFGDDKRGMSEAEKKELVSQLIAWAKKGGCFRRVVALTAIFFLLCYYHSIGKKVRALGFETR